MKKLSLFLALLTLLSCIVFPVSADSAALTAQEETATDYSIPLFGMNSLMNDAGSSGTISLDTENQVAGSGCNSAVIGNAGQGFTLRKNSVGTINASGFEFIEFEFYVSDASLLSKWDKFDHTSFEMTSSGTYDKNELGWTFPELLAANEGDEIEAGWNHVKVKLSTGHPDNDKDPGIDLNNVKFFRIYMANPHEDINVTVKFDNVRFTKTAPVEKKYVPIFDFDTVTQVSQRPDMPTVDTENHINGTGCNSFVTATNVICVEAAFSAVDISDCDYLCFWLWLEDPALASQFSFGQIELTSVGQTNGTNHTSYPTGNTTNWPKSAIQNLIVDGAKAGWNLVKLPLDTSVVPANGNSCDRTKLNFFRLNCTSDALKNKVIKFDNLYAYQEGATVPEPKRADEDGPVEKKYVKILDFDAYAFATLDTVNQLEGNGCATYTFKSADGTVAFLKKFDTPIDLSGCDYLEFWLYLSDISKVTAFDDGQIEVNSSGTYDAQEATWYINDNGLKDIIVGTPQDGWNLVRLDIHKQGFNGANWSNINWFRLYTTKGSNLAGATIRFDDMYAYEEGALIPTPSTETATVRSASLTLKGDIGLNVKMNLSNALIADPDAYVEMQWADGTGEAHVLPVSEATTEVSSAGDTRYVFTFPVPARRIYDDVNFRVFNGDGEQAVLLFTDAQKALENDTFTYAVSTYLESRIENSTDPKMVELAKTLLDYGSAAMTYFDYNASEAPAFINDLSTVTAASLADYEKALSSTTVDGIRFSAASLYLQSLTAINVKFTCTGDVSKYTFTCDNEVVEPVEEGGKYVVTLANIAAKDLDQMHVFSVSDGTNTQTLTYGALSFAASKLSGDSAVSNVAKTLYLYNVAANAYFAEN